MAHVRQGTSVLCAFLVSLVVLAFVGVSAGQAPSPDVVERLRQLTPEEREALLRTYGAPREGAVAPRDAVAPETVVPREQTESAVEAEVSRAAESVAPGPVDDAAVSAESGARIPFSDFLEGQRAGEIEARIEQFGYDLFAGAPTTFAPATDVPVSADYVIGPGDEIRVQLYGKTNLETALIVDRDGIVAFPEIGPITVAGLTFREMKDVVTQEVERRMIGVEASVTMGQLRSIRIFVLGDVHRPGSYTVSALSNLTNALFACGGVEKIGSLRRVQLKRDGIVVAELDLYDLLLEGDTSGDTRLMPGDVVFVPPVGPLVGVAGAVLRPAIYEIKGRATAYDLIEMAGGLRPTALKELIQLERITEGGRVTHDMSSAESRDRAVQDGDLLRVLTVPDRQEQVVFLEGNVVRPGKRQYFEGMSILDLIDSPDDLLPETFFGYGLIERESEVTREPEFLAYELGAALLDRDPGANVTLRSRDHVYVFHRSHFMDAPIVEARGEVRNPGSYEFMKDMRVLDLILAAGGLTRDAWLAEAELLRTDSATLDVSKVSIDLGQVLAGDDSTNVVLRDLDELVVHSAWEFRQKPEVEILGEVNRPGRYPKFEGMTISDLLFAGGNIKETAFSREAELTRYAIVDGERRELHHVLVDLDAVLAGRSDADIALQPYDRLLIRRIPNWRGDEVVTVSGEVRFPGRYPIEEGERLSDLVERFGGFLEDAYLPAAVFRRTEIKKLQHEQLTRMAAQLEADLARLSVSTAGTDDERGSEALQAGQRLLAELENAQAQGRVVVRLDDAEELRGSDDDLELADGDELFVPKRPDFVMVMGQVLNPMAFQYESGKNVGHYIRLAGGTTRFGDRGRAFVVKADGSVVKGRGRSRLGPGDVIIVPEDLERFSGMRFLMDVSQVLYQLGLAVASAYTVGLFD